MTYPGPATTTYAFDAFGNRTSKVDAGGTTSYSYDDNDRITTVTPPTPASAISYTWDNNGDLTGRGSDSFSWDVEDRLTSATVNSVTTTFAYRGDGLRDSRSSGGSTTTFTWDLNRGLPVVLDDGSQYVYGGGLEAMRSGSSWYYYLADGLGSTMAVVDASGAVAKSYTYDVYGKPTATGSLANAYDFAGQATDATGLQYLRARYMDPETGTFLSREPLAVFPGWTLPVVGYGLANPVLYSDPSGLVVTDGAGGGGTKGGPKGGGGGSGGGGGVKVPPNPAQQQHVFDEKHNWSAIPGSRASHLRLIEKVSGGNYNVAGKSVWEGGVYKGSTMVSEYRHKSGHLVCVKVFMRADGVTFFSDALVLLAGTAGGCADVWN